MFAATMLLVMIGRGVGISVDGATPKLHIIMAPIQVCIGIVDLLALLL
jgi:hypothetical protein